jgi:isochorismate synthase EntC
MRDAMVTTDAIEPTLKNWHRIQTVRRRRIRRIHQLIIIRHNNRNIQGTMEMHTSLQDEIDSNHICYKFKNGRMVWGNSPEKLTNAQYIGIMVAPLMA